MINLRLRISDFCSFEFAFVLFLFAGAYKSAPLVAELDAQADITVLTVLIGTVAGLLTLRDGVRWPNDLQLSFAATYALLLMLATGSYVSAASGHHEALLKLQKLAVFNTYAVCASLFIINTSQRVERLLRLILTFAMLAAVQALVTSRSADDVRFVGVFGSESYHALGYSTGMAIVIVSAALMAERRKFDRLILVGLGAIAAFALFLSSARQALIAVFPALLLLLPLFRQHQLRLVSLLRFLSIVTAGGLLFCAVQTYLFADTDLHRIWGRMLGLFSGQAGDVIVESARPVVWADGVDLGLAHPLFGAGFGTFPIYGETGMRHPHNYFVELLAELGIVGLVVGVVLVIPATRSIIREFRQGPLWSLTAARAIWVYLFSCAMLSGDLTDNRMMFAFMALSLIRGVPAARSTAASGRPVARPRVGGPMPRFDCPPAIPQQRAELAAGEGFRPPAQATAVRRPIV